MSIVAGFMVPHPPMIVPAIGRGSEKTIEETARAYERVAELVAKYAPETIVLSSPHSICYADYFHISPGAGATGSFARFGAGEVRFQVRYDGEFALHLSKNAASNGIEAGGLGEKDPSLDHGTMVPLYFILQKYTDFRLLRIGLSGFSLPVHYRLGMEIQNTAEQLGRRVVYIASGDLSHKLQESGPYGFDPNGPVYDERIMDVMGRGSFDELFDFDEHFLDKAAECGHRSFVMMAGAFDRTRLRIERLSHQDITGVGYGICTFEAQGGDGKDESRAFLDAYEARENARRAEAKMHEDLYVRLARRSLESYITSRRRISWEDVREELLAEERTRIAENPAEHRAGEHGAKEDDCAADFEHGLTDRRAGAFVSLHKEGRLRGCIGTIGPVRENLAEEIIENAISAGTKDPRFRPVAPEELPALEYSVDILGETQKISSESELDVKRYGVIVTKGGKRGLLLPNLDGVDTVAEQLRIAKQKAGLSPEEQGCALERFEVVRHF